jgi:hypothetical protein
MGCGKVSDKPEWVELPLARTQENGYACCLFPPGVRVRVRDGHIVPCGTAM